MSGNGGEDLARGLCVGLKRVQAQLESAIEEAKKKNQSTKEVTLSLIYSLSRLLFRGIFLPCRSFIPVISL